MQTENCTNTTGNQLHHLTSWMTSHKHKVYRFMFMFDIMNDYIINDE